MGDRVVVPPDILEKVRTKSSRREGSRFPHKLQILLNWAGTDRRRGEAAGCGWTTDSEFFVEKPVLGRTLKIEQNTLNVNLRQLGFVASRSAQGALTFWTQKGFSRDSRPETLDAIRNTRSHPERGPVDARALYFALLEPLQLWGLSPDDSAAFRREVLADWERLAGGAVIFAVHAAGVRSAIARDGGRPDLAWMLEEALDGDRADVCAFFDFAVLIARFGPYRTLISKIAQYHAIVKPERGAYAAPEFSQHFAATFHNCFRLPIAPDGEFHCYNLPSVEDGDAFLADEDGRTYPSWASVVDKNSPFLARYRPVM